MRSWPRYLDASLHFRHARPGTSASLLPGQRRRVPARGVGVGLFARPAHCRPSSHDPALIRLGGVDPVRLLSVRELALGYLDELIGAHATIVGTADGRTWFLEVGVTRFG